MSKSHDVGGNDRMDANQIYNENCIDTLSKIPDETLDMVITSPPYDNLRVYGGFNVDFESIIKELYRTMKQGGVVIWVVGDQTDNGSETGTSFRQALMFMDAGFNLHDTMLYVKKNPIPQPPYVRYAQSFEYMFCFSKGKPKTFNPIQVPTLSKGKEYQIKRNILDPNQAMKPKDTVYKVATSKPHSNMFEYSLHGNDTGHPAVFPNRLAYDQIISWSDPGDLIYDPFMGSGTVAVECMRTGRNYLGSEINPDYIPIIEKRIRDTDRSIPKTKLENYFEV